MAATKQRNIRIEDEPYEWAKAEAETRGVAIGDFIQELIEGARAGAAATETQTAGAPVLREAVDEAMRVNVEKLVGHLQPLMDALMLETVRGRMTAEEILAYQYDGDTLTCPSCHKPYAALQSGARFVDQRSAAILQKVRAALAAGRVPKVRAW